MQKQLIRVHSKIIKNVKKKFITEISNRKNLHHQKLEASKILMKLKPAITALRCGFEKVIEETYVIPIWQRSVRRVLIPKTNYLSIEKDYHLIVCLNTGLVAKIMRGHAM